MEKERATKAGEKLNLDKENGKKNTTVETKKKHADKPTTPWYGQKEDNKRGF